MRTSTAIDADSAAPMIATPQAEVQRPQTVHGNHLTSDGAELGTEKLQREILQLRRELELRNRALDAASAGFMIIDMRRAKRPIAYANKALLERTGYAPEELLDKPSAILTPAAANPEKANVIRDAMASGQELRLEIQTARKDGSLYWTGLALTPIRDASGNVTHYVSVSADITARLDAERKRQELYDRLQQEMKERQRVETELHLAQKLESVGRLAAGVAHEINTPIQYVGDSVYFLRGAWEDLQIVLNAYRTSFREIGEAKSWEEVRAKVAESERKADLEFLSAEVPKAFDRTSDGIDRVTQIVRAMKEFSHPDETQHQPADINHAIETTLVVARNEYKYLATVTTDFGELPDVICNIGELNQVLLNLIVNSAHAIEHAGRSADEGMISIATRVVDDQVELTFADNGCGIPQENIDKIFDPFFTTKEVGKGTGQGLAITRNIIVDKHHGQVTVTSEVGVGTKFVIRLPIARPPVEVEGT